MYYNNFWDYWNLGAKVTFDGTAKLILVNPDVTNLDIRIDVYSRWINWIQLYDNSSFLHAIRYTGLDPMGGGVFTGDIYFLKNGWKLQVDLTKVRITGALLSDDFDTAYYSYSGTAQYPVTVASLVTTVQVATPASIDVPALVDLVAAAVWNKSVSTPAPTSGSFGELVSKKLLTVGKFLGLK